MAQSRGRNPPWADLQPELISAIANFLITNPNPNPNFFDIHSFRSVCYSWRSSFPPSSNSSILSPILPITTIPPPSSLSGCYFSSAVRSITVVFLLRPNIIQSQNGFVLFVDEFECGKLRIRMPFRRLSFPSAEYFLEKVNLMDFHAREIGRFCNLSNNFYFNYNNDARVNKPKFGLDDFLKVVLCCDGSAAVALFDGGKLGFIRLDLGINVIGSRRNSDIQWEEILNDGIDILFDDIVQYKGGILGVDHEGRIFKIDPKSSKINVTAHVMHIAFKSIRRKRLVESLGVLHLVVKCDVGVSFKVYELNLRRKEWVEIDSIGDRVFFFGHEFSFSASAEEVSCRKNSFLFIQSSFRRYDGKLTYDGEVFCPLGPKGDDIMVYHLDGAVFVGADELYSGSSEMFWPPPAWLWPVDRDHWSNY